MEAVVVAGGSCALESEGVLLLDSTILMLRRRFPVAIEVKYTAPILHLVLDLLVHIHDTFLSQYLQLLLLLLRGISDYYVVQARLRRSVLLLLEVQARW